MICGKAVGADKIPVETWTSIGVKGFNYCADYSTMY